MQYFLIIIFLILVLAVVLLLWRKNKTCAIVSGQSRAKEERKQKILDILKENGKMSNKDIRKVLKIADRTVIQYADELEQAGKIKQVGRTGRNTYYALK
ncbi:MAG: winged helix-turn-helix transcriptional regulator [Parcubacteria group bacterium]|nr:winged helix-turn-helix transcriptional regulator [Parcubacteria group bacterium]